MILILVTSSGIFKLFNTGQILLYWHQQYNSNFRKTGKNPVLNTFEKPYPKNLYFKLLQNMQFIESTIKNSDKVDLKGSWEYKQADDPYDSPTWSFEIWQLKIIYLKEKQFLSTPSSTH